MSNPLAADLDHVLAHTRGLWEELRGRRVFLTGGTGFFGCWLLESFAWADEKFKLDASVIVLTRNVEALRRKAPHLAASRAIGFVEGDIRSFAFPKGEFPFIIHAAAEATPRSMRESPLEVWDNIAGGTRRVLEFARVCGAKKFLHTSSGAVYGPQPAGMSHIDECCGLAPNPASAASVYGEAKRQAELFCALYAAQGALEAKIARCFSFVGPYLPLDSHFAVGNFIRDALASRPIQVKGDGTAVRCYLYAADLAIWLWTILLRGRSCRPYNVGSEREITIGDLARMVASCVTPKVDVFIADQAAPGMAGSRYVPSTRAAREELNLAELVDLRESVRRTLSWHVAGTAGSARGGTS